MDEQELKSEVRGEVERKIKDLARKIYDQDKTIKEIQGLIFKLMTEELVEIKTMIKLQVQSIKDIKSDTERIIVKADKTNGRVKNLEIYRSFLIGAITVLSGFFYYFINKYL